VSTVTLCTRTGT